MTVKSLRTDSLFLNKFVNGIFVYCYGTFIVNSFCSLIFMWSKLSKPGISSEVRSLVLKRHVSTLFVCGICNLYIFSESMWLTKNDMTGIYKTGIWPATQKMLYYSQGYFYFLIRFSEPALI